MLRKVPLEIGETYHVFNRGAHKRTIFNDEHDYRRFLLNLHLANHGDPVLVRDVLESPKYREPFSGFPADKSLVDILAYALMPNHFHIVLRQKADGGITKFMRKVCVGYSMYFNLKHEHSGVLFQGRFKSQHIQNEPQFRWIFSYIHLNPMDLKYPGWKDGQISNTSDARLFLENYPYSSFPDYRGVTRPARAILSQEEIPDFLTDQNDLETLLSSISENGPVEFPENGSRGIFD